MEDLLEELLEDLLELLLLDFAEDLLEELLLRNSVCCQSSSHNLVTDLFVFLT